MDTANGGTNGGANGASDDVNENSGGDGQHGNDNNVNDNGVSNDCSSDDVEVDAYMAPVDCNYIRKRFFKHIKGTLPMKDFLPEVIKITTLIYFLLN